MDSWDRLTGLFVDLQYRNAPASEYIDHRSGHSFASRSNGYRVQVWIKDQMRECSGLGIEVFSQGEVRKEDLAILICDPVSDLLLGTVIE